MELRERTAIVTGGGVRLGRALALALARDGLNIAVHYHSSSEPAEQTVADIRALGPAAVAIPADFSDPDTAARSLVEQTVASLGSLDVLINSAAVFDAGTLSATTTEQWDRQLAINLKAPFFLCREFAARLQPDQRAHIVNIADWRGKRPDPDYLAYSVTKGALITLTKGLATALAPQVQVNAVSPGAILPPPGSDPAHMQRLAEAIPLRRTGSPDEVTEAVRFLLRSDFITGEVISVSGGRQL